MSSLVENFEFRGMVSYSKDDYDEVVPSMVTMMTNDAMMSIDFHEPSRTISRTFQYQEVKEQIGTDRQNELFFLCGGTTPGFTIRCL